MEQGECLQKYWRVLHELARRRFSFAELRVLFKILQSSYLRGLPDVYIASVEVLADSIESEKANVRKVLARLESRQILAHRGSHWWINNIDLWQSLGSDEHTDTGTARRAAVANARLLDDNRLKSNQLEWFAEITDAEVAAEANQEHAADWPLAGLPPTVSPDGPAPRSWRLGVENTSPGVKNTSGEPPAPPPEVNFTPDASTMSRGGARVRPDNQEIKPGNQEPREAGDSYVSFNGDRQAFYEAFIAWCEAAGPKATPEQINHWRWRCNHHPHLVERCWRETQAVIKEGRTPVYSRGGHCKMLWTRWAKEDKPTSGQAAGKPVAATAAKPQTVSAAAAAPVSEEERRALAGKAAQAKAELLAQIGKGRPNS